MRVSVLLRVEEVCKKEVEYKVDSKVGQTKAADEMTMLASDLTVVWVARLFADGTQVGNTEVRRIWVVGN